MFNSIVNNSANVYSFSEYKKFFQIEPKTEIPLRGRCPTIRARALIPDVCVGLAYLRLYLIAKFGIVFKKLLDGLASLGQPCVAVTEP